MTFITRFAPSPTGHLHLGHAYSALLAFDAAQQRGGRFILRIEDIDQGRCRPEFVDAIFQDLLWLGLHWEEPVRIQSQHMKEYLSCLQTMKDRGLIYPCFCTRSDIKVEIARAPSAPHGPDGPLYPGTCRGLNQDTAAQRINDGEPHAWRINCAKTMAALNGADIDWDEGDNKTIKAQPSLLGDAVVARKDTPTSYHLAVTYDDALQGITHIIRGEDLFHATHLHRLLQSIMRWPKPRYHHHPLQLDESGVRFAKRHKALTLASLREDGVTPADIRKRLGLSPRSTPKDG